jgi:hypothetical protein
MRVKVQRYIAMSGDQRFGIYIKRWWSPFWVRIDSWASEQNAIKRAELIKHPKPVEIT